MVTVPSEIRRANTLKMMELISDSEPYDPYVRKDEFTDKIRQLLEEGADPNAYNKTAIRATILMSCTELGYTNLVKLLLEYGANVNAIDKDGWNALHYAILNIQTEAAGILLDHGIDINARNQHGETPLAMAIRQLNYSVHNGSATGTMTDDQQQNIFLLLSHGADVSIVPNGYSLYDSVFEICEDEDMCKYLSDINEKIIAAKSMKSDASPDLEW